MDDFDDLVGEAIADTRAALPLGPETWPPPPRGGAGVGGAGPRAARRRPAATARAADPWAVLAGLGDGLVGCSDDEGGGGEHGVSQGPEGDGRGGGSDDDRAGSGGGRRRAGRGRRDSSGADSDHTTSSGAGEDVDSDDLVEADFDLDGSAVLSRIECFISDQVDAIARGQLPELELVSRAAGNTHMVVDGGDAGCSDDGGIGSDCGSGGEEGATSDGGSDGDDESAPAAASRGVGGTGGRAQTWTAGDASNGEEGEQPRPPRRRRRPRQGSQPRRVARVRLGTQTQVKSMTRSQGRQACAVARVFCVLEAVHELLRSGRQATQRDLYYKLVGPSLFPSVAAVNGAIQDAVALLRVPRSRLGIVCSSRGAAAGLVHLRDGPGGVWVDCGALGLAGWSIPGDIAAVERLSFRVSARYVLVIEKDAIFQRLVGDRLHERLPLVLVTAKGNPDLATRAFLSRLCASAPGLPVLGLVDWNPAGANILTTFKFGNPRMGLEGSRFALPRLRWLGCVSDMLDAVPRSAFHRLTQRDTALLIGLRRRLAGHPAWLQELAAMEERGLKCDIEALYSNGGFEALHTLLARRILRGQYL